MRREEPDRPTFASAAPRGWPPKKGSATAREGDGVRNDKKKKKPAATYSRAGESRTTLGDGALDFRVRNGNGYCSPSTATGEICAPQRETKENHDPHTRREGRSHACEAVKKKS